MRPRSSHQPEEPLQVLAWLEHVTPVRTSRNEAAAVLVQVCQCGRRGSQPRLGSG